MWEDGVGRIFWRFSFWRVYVLGVFKDYYLLNKVSGLRVGRRQVCDVSIFYGSNNFY